MYSKEQIEEIIKRIIHKDSFGDVHKEANKVSQELGLNISVGEKEFDQIKKSIIDPINKITISLIT